ncbi:TPA: hypothetical protein ACGY2Z_001609 [Listeria monocytogenes]
MTNYTSLEEHKYDGNYSEALVETLVDWTGIGLGFLASAGTVVVMGSGPAGWVVAGASIIVGTVVSSGVSTLKEPTLNAIDWVEDEIGGWFELNLGW